MTSTKRKCSSRLPLRVDGDPAISHWPHSSKRQKVTICNDGYAPTVKRSINNLRKALASHTLSSLHPLADVRDNRIIIPYISTNTYRLARAHIPILTGSNRIRIEYSSYKSELVVTMPTQIHEVLKGFASEIKSQMYLTKLSSGQAFMPPSWGRDRVLETGSSTLTLTNGTTTFRFEPDASLAFEPTNPFLILEVAVAQHTDSVKKKALHYITSSRGKIAFVVVVIVRRMKRLHGRQCRYQSPTDDVSHDNAANSTPGSEQDPENRRTPSSISTLTDPPSDLSQWNVFPEQHPVAQQASFRSTSTDRASNPDDCLPPLLYTLLDTNDILSPGDTVHASVFKSVAIPPSSDSASTVQLSHTMQPLIEEIEVYPRITTASFTVSWSDIAKTAPINCLPSLAIDLKPLSFLAQNLARDAHQRVSDDGFSPLSSVGVDNLPTSSTGEVDHERSGGTVPSSVEKQRDPDFEPRI
ncbi:MAG: hypothetical protein M1818_007418 [Claussenomyces sp. TS43310]|nr:MAG: hypothetical protein M1818_007418 [Claussenomyces sp. TS43310]